LALAKNTPARRPTIAFLPLVMKQNVIQRQANALYGNNNNYKNNHDESENSNTSSSVKELTKQNASRVLQTSRNFEEKDASN